MDYTFGDKALYDELGIIGEISLSDNEVCGSSECEDMESDTLYKSLNTPMSKAHTSHQSQCRAPSKIKKWNSSRSDKTQFKRFSKTKFSPAARSPDGVNVTQNVPNEIILEIFKYLDIKSLTLASSVCRRWNTIGNTSSLWRSMNLKRLEISIGDLESLLKRKTETLCLNSSTVVHGRDFGFITNRTHSKDSVYVSVLKERSSPHKNPFAQNYNFCLKYLDMTNAKIRTGSICLLLSRCQHLECLSLEGLALGQNVMSCISACLSLRKLNLSACSNISTSGIKNVLLCCRKMEELNIAWSSLSTYNPEQFLDVLPATMTHLNISGFRQTFQNGHVLAILNRCKYLRDLDVSDSNNLTDTVIDILLQNPNNNNLIGLSLSRCYGIPSETLLRLREMPTLHYLEIFGVMDDASVEMLSRALPNIYVCMRPFSRIARPTPSIYSFNLEQNQIWGHLAKL